MSPRDYRLTLDSDGVTPTAVQEVRPLEEALLVAPTPVQVLIKTRNGDLDAAWRWAADRLAAVRVEHLVGFDLRHRTYGPGVYLVLGRMNPESSGPLELSRTAEKQFPGLEGGDSAFADASGLGVGAVDRLLVARQRWWRLNGVRTVPPAP